MNMSAKNTSVENIANQIPVDKFYTYDELTQSLQCAAAAYPDLVTVSSIAESPMKRQVWCVEVAERRNGRPLHRRPALLMTGNLHAIELAGSCGALHLLRSLLEGYVTRDPQIVRLLQEQVVYIVPRLTVDATEYVLQSLHEVRSRRFDEREPNALYPHDVNQDGRVLFMRRPSRDGGYIKSSRDERIMLPCRGDEAGDAPRYDVTFEGLIHEWDGGAFSRREERLDFNRNFPAGWQPNFTSYIHGRYPLSEPETRGLAEFVLVHPNITRVVDYHTGNTAVFPPSGAVQSKALHAADAALIAKLGRRAEALTGFPFISGYTELSTGQIAAPLPGSFKDWIYEHTGATALILELGDFHNYLGISTKDYMCYPTVAEREEQMMLALLEWHDRHPEAGLFFEWEPFDHPQLGPVEIGGLNWVDWRNPPLHEMESVCANCTRFVLEVAELKPDVTVGESEVTPLGGSLYKVAVSVRNDGELPTHITQRGRETHPTEELQVSLNAVCAESAGAESASAESANQASLEFIVGRASTWIGHLEPGASRRIEWVVRTPQSPQASTRADGTGSDAGSGLRVSVEGARGVYVEASIEL